MIVIGMFWNILFLDLINKTQSSWKQGSQIFSHDILMIWTVELETFKDTKFQVSSANVSLSHQKAQIRSNNNNIFHVFQCNQFLYKIARTSLS